MKDKNKNNLSVDAENLPVPEVHTGKVETKDSEVENEKESISYETFAIPEIHIKNKKPENI